MFNYSLCYKKNLLFAIIISSMIVITSFTTNVNANAEASLTDPLMLNKQMEIVSDIINTAQSNQQYPYVKDDDFEIEKLSANSLVFQLFAPRSSGSDFYTDWGTVSHYKSAVELSEALQTYIPKQWGARELIAVYQINKDIWIASGHCINNNGDTIKDQKSTYYYQDDKTYFGTGKQYLIPEKYVQVVAVLAYGDQGNGLEFIYKKPKIDFSKTELVNLKSFTKEK
jgi:hypothetical protein